MGKPLKIPHSKGSRDGKRGRLALVVEMPEQENAAEGGVVIPFRVPKAIPTHKTDLAARYAALRKREDRASSLAEAWLRHRRQLQRTLARAMCASERAIRGR